MLRRIVASAVAVTLSFLAGPVIVAHAQTDVIADAALKCAINDARQISDLEAPIPATQVAGLSSIQGATENPACAELGPITSLEGLQHATALEWLFLGSQEITSPEPLRGLTSMTELDLSNNPIQSLTPIRGLTNLTVLNLQSVPLGSLADLAGLTSLQNLNVAGTGIDSLAPLSRLANFEWLMASDNAISDLSPLANLPALRALQLANNRISDVRPLTGKVLDHIDVSGNHLADLTPLSKVSSISAFDQTIQRPGIPVMGIVVRQADGTRLQPSLDEGNLKRADFSGTNFSVVATGESGTLYTRPGLHHVNGREWSTTCEFYSQTTRCATHIYATRVQEVIGNTPFVTNEWVFNNLTYLPSSRALWKGNPLGNTGEWTDSEGRRWRTECDTALTGDNACRTFTWQRVFGNLAKPGEPVRYGHVSTWVFNNLVLFR